MSTTEKRTTSSEPRRVKTAPGSRSGDRATSARYPGELEEIFARQRAAIERNPAPSLPERRANLLKLQRIVEQNRVLFVEAASSDFGTRGSVETERSEIVGTISMIRHMRRNLRVWMAPRRRSVPIWNKSARHKIEPRPLGVVGVVAPWNFPVHLALIPAATALAAGNRVMIKASEHTPRTSALLKRLISQNFSPEVIYVADGGDDIVTTFTKLPFDRLLFAGSTQVDQISASDAAGDIAPVRLGLCDKSPVIVDDDYSIEEAAAIVARAKLVNAGQVCVSPDYILVPRGREKEFAIATRHAARTLYPQVAGNPHYTAVLDQQHYDRLTAYITDAQSRDLEVLTAEDPALGRARRQLPLTLIINPPKEAKVMQEETFGPVLPIIGYDNEHTAVDYVNARSTPVVLYLLANAKGQQQKWLTRVPSETAVVNDLMTGYLQSDLPFRRDGRSGRDAIHGRAGFDAMSHLRPVSYQRALLGHRGRQILSPPYGKPADLVLKIMRRI